MTEYQNQILEKIKSHHCILGSDGDDNTLLWEYLNVEILKGKRRLLVISPKDLVNKLRVDFLEYYNNKKKGNMNTFPSYEEKRSIIFKDRNYSDITFAPETTTLYSGDYDVVILCNYDDFKNQKIHQTTISLVNARKNGRFIATAKKFVNLPLIDLLGAGECKIYSK